MVIFMADHGESFEHGYFYHGEELYENSTWIPLVIHYPGQKRGARLPGLTQPIDIAPTVLDVLQIPAPGWLDGHALTRDAPPRPTATIATNFKLPDGDLAYYMPTKLALWWTHYKLVASCEAGKKVLYDLASDPDEQMDVSALHPAVASEMMRRLGLRLARQTLTPRLDCPNLRPVVHP